jgi:hypothetical protein
MKNIETFYKGSGEFVNAFEKNDLVNNKSVFDKAEKMWYDEWVKQGKKDEGSCCGGKGLEVYYVKPRCRSATPINVVKCSFVQGNISAQKTHKTALDFLKQNGIVATYNDGWMD